MVDSKTLQERLDDENDRMISKDMFSSLVEFGCKPNWTMTEILIHFKNLSAGKIMALNESMNERATQIRRDSWKNPDRIDKQQHGN